MWVIVECIFIVISDDLFATIVVVVLLIRVDVVVVLRFLGEVQV